jgi:hypothetical protein
MKSLLAYLVLALITASIWFVVCFARFPTATADWVAIGVMTAILFIAFVVWSIPRQQKTKNCGA